MKQSLPRRGALGAAVTLYVAAVALACGSAYAATPGQEKAGAMQEQPGTTQEKSTATQEKPARTSSDAMITTKVKAAFVKDEQVHALKIKVSTNKGVVQLSGYAGSAQEAEHAAELARKVPGVKDVKSEIQLKPAPAN